MADPRFGGRVPRTPFERLQSWYDPNAIKTALDMPLQKRTDILDISRIVTRASRQPVIELVIPRGRADKPFVSLGLRFTTVLDKPRLLTVRVEQHTRRDRMARRHLHSRSRADSHRRSTGAAPPGADCCAVGKRTDHSGEFRICFYLDGIRDRCHVMLAGGLR